MPTQLANFGMQAAQQAAGGIMGIAFGAINDRRQLRQQEKLQALEISGQKAMTDYNMAKQLQMWKDTNYGAQMEQLQKAGLNPGLIYGMGGGGGQTTNIQPGRVTGGQAPTGGGEAIAMANTAAQLGLMRAQKENIEADTANKQAETQVKTTTVPKLEAETKSLLQGIENAKAQQELTTLQTDIQRIEEDIKGATQNAAKALIFTTLRQATESLQMLTNDKAISDATKDEKIKIIEQELIGSFARNELTKAQAGKTTAETEQLAKTIALEYDKLKNQKDQTQINKQLADFETNFGKQAGGILGTLLQTIRGRR